MQPTRERHAENFAGCLMKSIAQAPAGVARRKWRIRPLWGGKHQTDESTPANSQAQAPEQENSATRTSRFEQFLLVMMILPLPVENLLPTLGRFSVAFIPFALATTYLLVFRLRSFFHCLRHPIFLWWALLLYVGGVIEYLHGDPQLTQIFRIAQMVFGAAIVATLARDRFSLQLGFFSFIIIALLLTAGLYRTSSKILFTTQRMDFTQATTIREEAFEDSSLYADINRLSFLVALGAVLCFAYALTNKQLWKSGAWLVGVLICLFGTSLTLSRSGIAVAAMALAVILLCYRGNMTRAMMTVCIVGALTLILAPDAIFSRLSYGATSQSGKLEGRAVVYSNVLNAIPDYLAFGMGSGYYWNVWSPNQWGRSLGAHNSFFQITLYWGITGLLVFLGVFYACYRALPKRAGKDALALCLWGLAVAMFARLCSTHGMYNKEFSIGFGLVVAASTWIWPTRRSKAATNQRPQYDALGIVSSKPG